VLNSGGSICVKSDAGCRFYKAEDSSASPHKRDEIIHVGCNTTKDFVIYKNNSIVEVNEFWFTVARTCSFDRET
jgi:hypothetical protein